MTSERGKSGREVIKKEGRLGDEKERERIGPVEQFLKQRGRKTEASTIKNEGSIKNERSIKKEGSIKNERSIKKEGSIRGAKKEDKDREGRKTEERLRAIQEDPGEVEKPKSWLTREMEKIEFDEGSDPTKEDIKLQLRLSLFIKFECGLDLLNELCNGVWR